MLCIWATRSVGLPMSDLSELLEAITKLATIEEAGCRVADCWVHCWVQFHGVNAGNVVALGALESKLFKALDDLERATEFSRDLRKHHRVEP